MIQSDLNNIFQRDRYTTDLSPGEMCAPLVIAAKNALSIGDAKVAPCLGY